MKANVKIRHSFDEILNELGENQVANKLHDIIALKAGDRFFIGGGCEAYIIKNPRVQNVSICSDVSCER